MLRGGVEKMTVYEYFKVGKQLTWGKETKKTDRGGEGREGGRE